MAPFFLASERPMAIACFLDLTFGPFLPDVSFPVFILCSASFTVSCDFLLYLGIDSNKLTDHFFDVFGELGRNIFSFALADMFTEG